MVARNVSLLCQILVMELAGSNVTVESVDKCILEFYICSLEESV